MQKIQDLVQNNMNYILVGITLLGGSYIMFETVMQLVGMFSGGGGSNDQQPAKQAQKERQGDKKESIGGGGDSSGGGSDQSSSNSGGGSDQQPQGQVDTTDDTAPSGGPSFDQNKLTVNRRPQQQQQTSGGTATRIVKKTGGGVSSEQLEALRKQIEKQREMQKKQNERLNERLKQVRNRYQKQVNELKNMRQKQKQKTQQVRNQLQQKKRTIQELTKRMKQKQKIEKEESGLTEKNSYPHFAPKDRGAASLDLVNIPAGEKLTGWMRWGLGLVEGDREPVLIDLQNGAQLRAMAFAKPLTERIVIVMNEENPGLYIDRDQQMYRIYGRVYAQSDGEIGLPAEVESSEGMATALSIFGGIGSSAAQAYSKIGTQERAATPQDQQQGVTREEIIGSTASPILSQVQQQANRLFQKPDILKTDANQGIILQIHPRPMEGVGGGNITDDDQQFDYKGKGGENVTGNINPDVGPNK